MLERCTPRRIKHNRRSNYVEEFLVQWDPEECTLQEAQIQQAQGFVITKITSLDEGIPTPLLEAATATKRPRGRPRAADRPPPDTKCRVQFAPSPQGTTHIRTIRGGHEALETFLLKEKTQPELLHNHSTAPDAPHPSKTTETPAHRRIQSIDPLLRPRIHPPNGAPHRPHLLGPHVECTQTSFKSSRRKGTLTGTLSPKRDHTSP